MGDRDIYSVFGEEAEPVTFQNPYSVFGKGVEPVKIQDNLTATATINQTIKGAPDEQDQRSNAQAAKILAYETGVDAGEIFSAIDLYNELDNGTKQNPKQYHDRLWERLRGGYVGIFGADPAILQHMFSKRYRTPEHEANIRKMLDNLPAADQMWNALPGPVREKMKQSGMEEFFKAGVMPSQIAAADIEEMAELQREAGGVYQANPYLSKTEAIRLFIDTMGLRKDPLVAQFLLEAANVFPQISVGFASQLAGMGIGAGVGYLAAGPGGVAPGAAIGGRTLSYMQMALAEAAPDYWDMVEQGIDPDIACPIALVSGIAKAPIEFMQVSQVFGPLLRGVAGKEVFNMLTSQSYKAGVKAVVNRTIRNGAIRQFVTGTAAREARGFLPTLIKEAVWEEGAQGGIEFVLKELAIELNNRFKGTEYEHHWGEFGPQIIETVTRAAMGFAPIQVLTAGLGVGAGAMREMGQAGKKALGAKPAEVTKIAEAPGVEKKPAVTAETRPIIPPEMKPQAVAAMKATPLPEGAPGGAAAEAPEEPESIFAIRTKDGKIHADATATSHFEVGDNQRIDPVDFEESGRIVRGKYIDEEQYQKWVAEGANPEDLPEESHVRFWEGLRRAYPNIPDEQIDALVTLEETRAQALGLTLEEDITKFYQPEIGKEGVPPAGALEQRNPENRIKIAEKAIAHFGSTLDPREAGYIFPDGTMLDFSGKKEGGLAFAARRGMDHKEIGKFFPVGDTEEAYNHWAPVARFQEASGAVRFDIYGDMGICSVVETPTDEQMRVMVNAWRRFRANQVYVSITDDKGYDTASGEFYQPTVEKLKHFFTEKKLVGSRLIYHQPGKGAVSFDPADGKALLYGSQQSDFSTGLHEYAHIWRRQLEPRDMSILEHWLEVKEGKWSKENEEQFANGLEQYVKENVLPKPWLKDLFDKFKEWLKNIYERFAQFHMPEEVKKVYEGLFITPQEKRIRGMFAPFAEEELKPAALETKLAPLVKRDVRGLGLNKAEIASLISLYGTHYGPSEEQKPPGYTGPALGTLKNRALDYIVRQMKANPARWRSIMLQDQIRGLEGHMTEEDKGMLEEYEVLRETLAARAGKKDIDRVVSEIVRTPEEEIKTEPTVAKPKEYVYDENYTGTKPESLPDGRIRIGPKYFTYSKSQQIRMLRDALTSARREARLQTRLATAEERAKGKAKMAAYKQREKTNERIKKLRQLKTDIEKGKFHIAPEYLTPIKSILSGLDVVGLTKTFKAELQQIADYIKGNPDAEIGETIPETVMDQLPRLEMKNIKEMTDDEIETLYISIMHYKHLASEESYLSYLDKKAEFTVLRSKAFAELPTPKKLKDSIVNLEGNAPDLIKAKIKDAWDTWGVGIGQDHYDLIVEKIAGMHSLIDDLFYWNVKEGRRTAQELDHKLKTRVMDTVADLGLKNPLGFWSEKETHGKLTINRARRMALYMHNQNEDNWTSVTVGGIGNHFSAQPNRVYRQGVDFDNGALEEHLSNMTTEEKVLCKLGAEIAEENGKLLSGVFAEVNGYELPLIENYWHKDTMPIGRAKDAEKQAFEEARKREWVRVGLPKGYLKARKGKIIPLYLNDFFFDIQRDIERTASYVGFEKPLRAASKLLYDREYREVFEKTVGTRVWKEIERGLKDIVSEQTAITDFDKALGKIRRAMTMAYISLTPFPVLKQFLQLANGGVYIKPDYLLRGMLDTIVKHKQVFDLHKMMSPEFLERLMVGPGRDIAEIQRRQQAKILAGGKTILRKIGTFAIRKSDIHVVAAVMRGAVLQVLDDFKTGKLSEEAAKALNITDEMIARLSADERLKLAYKFGDYVVERTQDMGLPEHRSPMSRGSEVQRLLTWFGNSTNQNWNLLKRAALEAHRTGSISTTMKLVKAIVSVLFLQTLGEAAIEALRDSLTKRKRDRKKLDFLWHALDSVAGNWYILRDIWEGITRKFRYGWGGELSVAPIEVGNKIITVGAEIAGLFKKQSRLRRKRLASRLAWSTTELFLLLGGLPFYAPLRLGKKIYERFKK